MLIDRAVFKYCIAKKDDEIPSHSHDTYAIVTVITGEIHISIEGGHGGKRVLKPISSYEIQAGTEHALIFSEDTEYAMVKIR